MIGEFDPSQYFGLLAIVGYFIYRIVKWAVGEKNEQLDEFLKSLDADEEELEKAPVTVPKQIVKEVPRHPPKKHAAPPPPYQPAAPRKPMFAPEIKKVAVQQERLLNPRNIQKAIVIQTILNKPKGAWW